MTEVGAADDATVATTGSQAGLGTLGSRIAALAASEFGGEVTAFLLSFALVVLLGADSGGYWSTSWDWTALAMLFVSTVILLARTDVRISPLDAVMPLGLLALTLWGIVSVAWSSSATAPLLESQRVLVYAVTAFAAILIVRIGTYRALLGGVWAGIVAVCVYSLMTRVFPAHFAFADAVAENRLESPLGYWNALAMFAAIGALLALGFAARGQRLVVRVLAAASMVILIPVLYFTFSRGGWIALGAGLIVMVAVDERRLQLITTLAVVALWPALAVWGASRSAPLTHVVGAVAAAEHAGRHFAVTVVVLTLAAAGVMAAYVLLESRVRISSVIRIAYVVLLVLVLAAAVAATTVRYGSPATIARKGYHSLLGRDLPVPRNGDLNTRFFRLGLGLRVQQFQVAWDEYLDHPWLGTGEGTYARYWDQNRTQAFEIENVHNLYLETLAELGPIGLALLLTALAAPFVAFFKARRRALASAALAGYVAFLLHVSVDWDWQMPAVTLAALFCGLALLAAARRERPEPMRAVTRGAIAAFLVLLGVFAFAGLKSNLDLGSSRAAAARADYAKAARDARSAQLWSPWSSAPWQLLGEAQAGQNQDAAAAVSFRHALSSDDANWQLWFDLAKVTTGPAQQQAVRAAFALNPLSPELVTWLEQG